MKSLKVNGNKYLSGSIRINGSKNSALPIIAGAILNKGIVRLEDVPNISDIIDMLEILKMLNVKYSYINNVLTINSTKIQYNDLISPSVKKIRASYYFIGSMLSLFKQVNINTPGGCQIGSRPIDYHIKVMEEMGGIYSFNKDILNIRIEEFNKIKFRFKRKSVGATINALLASVYSNKVIVLHNIAKEPEVIDVINFLNKMGCNIKIYKNKYICKNHKGLSKDITYKIIPDRIEAATYLSMGLLCGEIEVFNVCKKHLKHFIKPLIKNNANLLIKKDSIMAFQSKIKSFDITVKEYPGFPTDMQPIIMVLFSLCDGSGVVKDDIFENRFKACVMLNKMGANVSISKSEANYKGVNELSSCEVEATDLRAAASLLLACLKAKGTSVISNIDYIERGYADIYENVRKLGGDISLE